MAVLVFAAGASQNRSASPPTSPSPALAGAALGLGQTLASCALTHLTLHASPRGREALAFTLLGFFRAAGTSLSTMLMPHLILSGSIEKVPCLAFATCALALLALWFVPRDLLGDDTVTTWPTRRKLTTEPPASDASSSGPSPG